MNTFTNNTTLFSVSMLFEGQFGEDIGRDPSHRVSWGSQSLWEDPRAYEEYRSTNHGCEEDDRHLGQSLLLTTPCQRYERVITLVQDVQFIP